MAGAPATAYLGARTAAASSPALPATSSTRSPELAPRRVPTPISLGQFDLFGGQPGTGAGLNLFDVPVPAEQWDAKHQLALEREMLGLYASGHPLHGVERTLARQADTPIASILDGSVSDGAQVIVGGILAGVTRRVNRNGEPWAAAQLEDLAAGIEVLFFPKTYSVVGVNVAEDHIVLVKARVTKRDDRISLIANDLVVPDLAQLGGPPPRLPGSAAEPGQRRSQTPAEARRQPAGDPEQRVDG